MIINVSVDFSKYPGGRKVEHGPFSGEEFLEKILLPALSTHGHITINMNGLAAISPSFLDESIGSLIRKYGVKKFEEKVTIILDDDLDTLELLEYIKTNENL